jgi:hypothetical protein
VTGRPGDGSAPDEFAPDEFDRVPEDGLRQGAHRGHRPTVRVSTRELTAIVVAGTLTLGIGAWAYTTDPAAPGDAGPGAPSSSAPAAP